MKGTRVLALSVSVSLGIAPLLGVSCKRDGSAVDSTSTESKPLITKPYDQLTKEDLEAAITGLAWKPEQSGNSQTGGVSSFHVTAVKDGSPSPELTVMVFKVPPAEPEGWKVSLADYAFDAKGTSTLAVKYHPADPAAAKKTLRRLLGK